MTERSPFSDHQQTHSLPDKRVVYISIAFLVLAVVLWVAIDWCKRLACRRYNNEIAASSSLHDAAPAPTSFVIVIDDGRLQQLEQQIPLDIVREETDHDRQDSGDCPVCLEQFVAGEAVRVLPKCSHRFHRACIDEWLRQSVQCPVCRRKILWLI